LTIYADTSFFISLYVRDSHSTNADRLLASASAPWFTPLHFAEWTHAVAAQVFRGYMTTAEAGRAQQELAGDRDAGLWINIDVPDNAFNVCADLGRRFGPKLGVRTLDSLHVACALELKAERFWTFDDRQVKLARAVGLKTR
jgi:predicted nucleic acid-binding protein